MSNNDSYTYISSTVIHFETRFDHGNHAFGSEVASHTIDIGLTPDKDLCPRSASVRD